MDLVQVGLAALERLDRSPEYYDGLEGRLGFPVRDGRAFLVHCAGVSFNDETTGRDRQDILKDAKAFCSFENSPPVTLVPEPTNQYDANAMQVHIGIGADEVTSEWTMQQAGFLPKKRCPICCASLSGKKASAQLCSECDANVGIDSDFSGFEVVNEWVMQAFEQGKVVRAGVDNITVPQHTQGNMGLDVWVRIDEPAEGQDPTL